MDIHVEGSGVVTLLPVVALIIPMSPSTSVGLSETVVVNVGRMDTGAPPEFSEIVSGLKSPVRVAETGMGLVPPMGMAEPSKDSPSGDKVKYVDGSVAIEPSLKVTIKLKLDRFNVVVMGKVVSGNVDAFGPVSLTMSKAPELAGKFTSQLM
jgi:hypothetical protein